MSEPESDGDKIQQAGELAEKLANEVTGRAGELDAVYDALEKAAENYRQAGGSLEAIVPGASEASLGFRRGRPDGKSIWNAYAKVLRDEVCKPKGSLHKQVNVGLTMSGASLVTLIIATLGLPAAAALVVGPIAGSILGLGVKAFCKYTESSE